MSEPLEFQNFGELDELIRGLLLRANQPEALGITRENLEEVPAWVETQMASFLADPLGYARRKTRPVWKRTLRYAAAFLLTVSMSLFTIYQVSPTARAWMDEVFQVVVTWMDKNTTFHFGGEQTEGTADDIWRPTWLPEGYVETRSVNLSGAMKVRFENHIGGSIVFEYMPVQEGYMLDVDNNHSNYSVIVLNGQAAYLFESSTVGKPSFLIWHNEAETVAFQLTAELPIGDLIQIAESVIVQNR